MTLEALPPAPSPNGNGPERPGYTLRTDLLSEMRQRERTLLTQLDQVRLTIKGLEDSMKMEALQRMSPAERYYWQELGIGDPPYRHLLMGETPDAWGTPPANRVPHSQRWPDE